MPRGHLTNRSGTIASGGSSQELSPQNLRRVFFFFQNNSQADLWINLVDDAAVDATIRVSAGAEFNMTYLEWVDTARVSVYGPTTGQQFACWEG